MQRSLQIRFLYNKENNLFVISDIFNQFYDLTT